MGIYNKQVWDREKQTYFILRRGNPWRVVNMKTNLGVADYPAYLYNVTLEEAICFAASDEAVVELLRNREQKTPPEIHPGEFSFPRADDEQRGT